MVRNSTEWECACELVCELGDKVELECMYCLHKYKAVKGRSSSLLVLLQGSRPAADRLLFCSSLAQVYGEWTAPCLFLQALAIMKPKGSYYFDPGMCC